jgi:DnaJ-class molecular chaperone
MPEGDQMPKMAAKVIERICSACDGTGVLPVIKQSAQPGRRIYPPRCEKCGGKGRITKAAN